jgi:transposase
MEKDTTTYVGLDDSKRKLVVAILRPGEREPEQREMPKEPHLIQRLFRRLTREGAVAACYEAGVSGYDLYRQITACGAVCQVIAPALTPRRPGQRIKTNRRDAVKLVRLFRAGELTAVHVPDEAEEAVRDLLRCREGVRRDVLRWRHRLLKFLDRHGRLYVTGKNWSQRHWTWIRGQRFDLAPVPPTYSVRLVSIEVPAGLIDDGRHDYPHPHRPPPRAHNPPRPGARKSGVAAPTGRPRAHRAASTPATL